MIDELAWFFLACALAAYGAGVGACLSIPRGRCAGILRGFALNNEGNFDA